ncbi:hypothetical protein FISHEDRAFT_77842 [Fistulina hepatica ATCC 64428]|nr:hypothetical protein FISHEDRAFT_77842 [Fistulina hepatica ATCC 64428]
MPYDNKGTPYTYSGSGTNDQGNHYCSRQTSDGSSGYHYSNQDGSYHYKNFDGSSYHNNGQGSSTYTAPNGYQSKSSGGK